MTQQISRNSCDTFTNKFGNQLIEIVKKADLKILIGRTLGDVTGNYTCTQYNGKSVVDYGIINDTLFQKCKYFIVSELNNPISDHANITFALNIRKTEHNTSKNVPTSGSCPLKYIWDEDSDQKFRVFSILLFIQKFNNSLKMITNLMPKVLIFAAMTCQIENSEYCLKCIRPKYRKPKKPRKDQMGFDNDCKSLKQQVLHLAKLLRQFPGDPIVYGHFISAKKDFQIYGSKKNHRNQKISACHDS